MEIELNVAQLAQVTQRMQGALSETSLPYISLQTENQTLSLSATDRVLSVFCSIDCEVIQAGSLSVPARLFCNIAKQLPAGKIRLLRTQASLQIIAAEAQLQMKIPLLDGVTWKAAPTMNDASASCWLPSVKLAYMLGQVQACISQESQKNYGAVAYFHRNGASGLRVVGTDGFRLSYCEVQVDLPTTFLETNGFCLSKRGINELLRMCQEVSSDIELTLFEGGTKLMARTGEYRLFFALSSVDFPNYLGVIPKKLKFRVNLARGELQQAAKRILLVSDKTNAIMLSFSTEALTLKSKAADTSEGFEALSIEAYTGPEVKLVVNGRFLLDVLSVLSGNELYIEFSNEDTPLVLYSAEENQTYQAQHLLVPIKENRE